MSIGVDYKIFWWHMPDAVLPEALTNVLMVDLSYAEVPGLFDLMNEGFKPLSHNVIPRDKGVLLSILLVRDIEAPDTIDFSADDTD